MGWLENLKSLISANIDFSALKEIKLVRDIKDNSFVKVDNRKILVVNVGAKELQSKEAQQQLKQIINDALNVDGQPVIEEEASKVIDDIAANDDYQSTVEFLSGKIPAEDLRILRAAIYLRIVHERGDSVDKLKSDLVVRYGQRGSNITNLCSAGYFESHIIPMYEQFEKRPNFTKENFKNYYNQIIENAPFAIFVSRHQTADEVKTQIIEKVTFNKNYGITALNVHAIGPENVKKVQAVLQDEEVVELFTTEPDVIIEGNVISAHLYY